MPERNLDTAEHDKQEAGWSRLHGGKDKGVAGDTKYTYCKIEVEETTNG